jgi:predicted extracellular nuclease
LIYANGSSSPTNTIDLAGVVVDGDVYVIAHPSASQAVLDEADATFGNILFNGDDAVALTKGGVPIDVIGQIGFDPGAQWGSGVVSTEDNTLRRKDLVFGGDPDGSNAFNPFVEWIGFPEDTVDGLGIHAIRTQVPEPASLAFFGLGVAGLALMRRRRAR